MTQFSTKDPNLTVDEWHELQALRQAINLNPASVHYNEMERFADLMVRTLLDKSDCPENK